MIGEYRFFNEFFDGQVLKKESEKFKLFKLMLVSIFSVAGLYLYLSGTSGFFVVALLALGMIWNFYSPLGKNISLLFGTVVGVIYCIVAATFRLYSNALLYIGFYIPLQLAAVSKDYSEGDHIQIKKYITDLNKILFILFFAVSCVIFALFSSSLGGRYIVVDALSAGLLVSSAVLRNERYFEYYIFRVFALLLSIVLWITAFIEYGNLDIIPIILMYSSYLIFDITSYIYQRATYVNEYMIATSKYKKEENEKIVQKKLEVYKKSENSKQKNSENKK